MDELLLRPEDLPFKRGPVYYTIEVEVFTDAPATHVAAQIHRAVAGLAVNLPQTAGEMAMVSRVVIAERERPRWIAASDVVGPSCAVCGGAIYRQTLDGDWVHCLPAAHDAVRV
jgi:hypothetical protein